MTENESSNTITAVENRREKNERAEAFFRRTLTGRALVLLYLAITWVLPGAVISIWLAIAAVYLVDASYTAMIVGLIAGFPVAAFLGTYSIVIRDSPRTTRNRLRIIINPQHARLLYYSSQESAFCCLPSFPD